MSHDKLPEDFDICYLPLLENQNLAHAKIQKKKENNTATAHIQPIGTSQKVHHIYDT
jgi:hypothetical protein